MLALTVLISLKIEDAFGLFVHVVCVSAGLLSESFHSLTRRAEQEALAKVHM